MNAGVKGAEVVEMHDRASVSIAGLVALTVLVGGCVSVPPPSGAPSLAAETPSATCVSLVDAVELARTAARALEPWLGDGAVSVARHDRYGGIRDTRSPQVSPVPPVDRSVWTIVLFDKGSGQGAMVLIDACDGRVLQSRAFIT